MNIDWAKRCPCFFPACQTIFATRLSHVLSFFVSVSFGSEKRKKQETDLPVNTFQQWFWWQRWWSRVTVVHPDQKRQMFQPSSGMTAREKITRSTGPWREGKTKNTNSSKETWIECCKLMRNKLCLFSMGIFPYCKMGDWWFHNLLQVEPPPYKANERGCDGSKAVIYERLCSRNSWWIIWGLSGFQFDIMFLMMLPHWFIRLLKFGARTINHWGAQSRDKLRCEYWFGAIDHSPATQPSQCAPWEIWWHMAILRSIDWWIGVLRCSLIIFLMTKLHYLLVYWLGEKGVYCAGPPCLAVKLGCVVISRRQHSHLQRLRHCLSPSFYGFSLMQYWFAWKEIDNSLAIFYYLRNRFGDSFSCRC